MKVVTAKEMQEIDRKTIRTIGVPGSVLMERAGTAVAARVNELFGRKKTIVLAGGGNNGGDGIVAARELLNLGWNVWILFLAREDGLSPDCLAQLRIAKQMGVPFEFRNKIETKDVHGAVVVDALFGTGLSRNVEGAAAKVITFLNRSGTPVISVDVPSGISSDSGQIMGVAVRAAFTVTFGLPKRGHLLYPGADHTGKLFVEKIGFPEKLLASEALNVELMERGMLSHLVPERPRYSHKSDYGHVLVVAGSKGKTGAAFMTAKACMRAGAGLVTLGVPESLIDLFQGRVTEEMTLTLPDAGDGTLSAKAADTILGFTSKRADVLCIGPGIGVSDEMKKVISSVIVSSRTPMVIDADGINSLCEISTRGLGTKDMLKKALAPILLTPHPGEMARLLRGTARRGRVDEGIPASDLRSRIEKDRINTALSFARATGTYLVLKGVPTVIAGPHGKVFINPTGNPGMATAGSGDVLSGMVASFLAQGLDPMSSAMLGVYMHGLAGDCAAEGKGMASLIASDIIESLPAAFKEMLG
ncbi:MAG TPA: NAD(P)H-hydrate dehydratase [Thermodesulfovibrionales bacterium]|nr:NAD(P)H-hydrate dehydratase [Thermodesulfovibrionales bacterium]